MSLKRRVKALESARKPKGGSFVVLLHFEGEPEPKAPEGYGGLVVVIRKPEQRSAYQ